MAIASLSRRPISRYQGPSAPSRRPPPPLPPRWVERGRGVEMPPLSHFVLLSFLLHILAIALVGAPSGGSREGRAMWGSLDVRLVPARPSVPTPAPAGTATRDAPPAPLPFPRLLDRIATPEPTRETTPKLVVPPPIEAQPATPAPPPTPAAPAAPAPAAPPTVAIPLPLPKPPAARPAYQTLVDSPVVLEAPAAPAPVIETPRVLLVPTPPQADRTLLEAPRVLVAPAPAPFAAPAVPIPAPAPLPAPAPESLVLPRPVDPALTREVATPPPGTPTAERLPRLDPATRIERDTPRAPPEPVASPFRSPAPPAPRANDTSSYDPTAPSLDPEALRKRAASLAREGSGQRAVLPFPMPPVPEKKGKMEELIDKARKPDCRTAYQQLGLAAIIPLIANEIGEGTCRW